MISTWANIACWHYAVYKGGKFGWRIGLFNRIANKRQKIQYVSEKKENVSQSASKRHAVKLRIHIAIYISIFFLQEIQ